MNKLTIGQVARRAEIGIETIRFYERKGLIDEPERKASGYRQYKDDVILRLAFIQQTKTLGFSLNEIRDLLSIRASSGSVTKEIKQLAGVKLDEIKIKIKVLRRMQRTLTDLVQRCPGEGSESDCPILQTLHSPGINHIRK